MPDFLEQRGRCYPVEEWERLNAAVQTSLKTGIGYELDVQAIRDGEPIWVTTRGEVVSDLDGQIVGLRGAVQDITERKQTEAVLQESQGRLVAELVAMKRLHQIGTRFVRNGELGKVLEEVVDAAIAITGSDMGNLQLLDNSGLLKIVAQRGFEQPFLDFFNSVHEGQAACGTALQQGNRVIVEDIAESVVFAGSPAREVVLASGARAVQSTPLRSRSGHLLGMLSTHYKTPRRPDERDLLFIDVLSQQIGDMLERMRMEEELRKSRDELELRVQERTVELGPTVAKLNSKCGTSGICFRRISRSPGTPAQDTDFLRHGPKRCAPVLDSTSKDYLDRVVNSASRMRQLLRDLLDFSRVATRLEPFKKIDLVKIVREAADVFEASVKETGCQIEIENIPAIEADETQMLRLFQNLIGNALKFRSGETPHIKVYGKLDRKRICEIFVKDNGIGFNPKFAELIFKPFQRLHGRSEYDGTGMGLAICRKIVERHGGSIRAESEQGKGSTFIIRLPVKNRPVGGHIVCRKDHQKTVLMADDDAEDCRLATKAFAESGAKVVFSCVLDGIELMNHLTEHSRSEAKGLPDLILLDLNMPRKNGWQALIEIKAEPALQHIPIVILTTSEEQEMSTSQ